MTGIAPDTAGVVERGLDETAAARLDALPASLPVLAWDADTLPASWLPVLAWALSVDVWNPEWPPEQQRAAINGAYEQHRLKGTPAGLKLVLDRIGAVYELTERPRDVPFTISIDIYNLAAITLPSEARMLEILNRVRRASVHLAVTAHAGAMVDLPVAVGAGAVAFAPLIARLAIDEGSPE